MGRRDLIKSFWSLLGFFTVSACTPQMVFTAGALQREMSFQEIIGGLGINFAQKTLQEWLPESHCQVCVMGVYGMTGIGKTSLLKLIYNSYKKEISIDIGRHVESNGLGVKLVENNDSKVLISTCIRNFTKEGWELFWRKVLQELFWRRL